MMNAEVFVCQTEMLELLSKPVPSIASIFSIVSYC
jgi:hypothetical protein